MMGVEELPFDHITAGAISGDWYSGRVTDKGIPTALQRDGARPGVLTLESGPTGEVQRFTVTGEGDSVQMAVGVSSPRYRECFEANRDNGGSAPEFTNPTTVSADDHSGGTYLTSNVFAGSSQIEVSTETIEFTVSA